MDKVAKILVVGTADTKADEILFIGDCLRLNGAEAVVMDVGVLGDTSFEVAFSKHTVAEAADATIEEIIALGDENHAMAKMAQGASALAARLHREGHIDALLALGGTMGTDLALDVALALPLGVPKFVVSTVAFSHLIPAERLAPDLMMILWAGGLYGLNSVCRSVLSQAAGAVSGAVATVAPPQRSQPVVAVSSLGKSCLSYMVGLVPELERRGYEVAVFHATGMGGRAMETLAARGAFAAVLDFALSEVGNSVFGGSAGAGPDRLEGAGRAGTPQIVAPGAMDMIDFATWGVIPQRFAARDYHAHNRLIASVALNVEEREVLAAELSRKLGGAKGPTAFVLPLQGIEEWDREGAPMHDPEAHRAFSAKLRSTLQPPVRLVEVDAHINDPAFVEAVLSVFDGWVSEGLVPQGAPSSARAA